MDFGMYDLMQYFKAGNDLQALEVEYQADREQILNSLYPVQFVNETFDIVTCQKPTETAAIELVSLYEGVASRKRNLQNKIDRLQQALDTLTPDELKAVKLAIWNKQYNVDVFDRAVGKLFQCLSESQEKAAEEKRTEGIKQTVS